MAAIPPGRDWAQQIEDAIEASSFLIPIVTPGFLQSEWCNKEVQTFRQREERLGTRRLIFPIHYIDTSHLDGADPHECRDPRVLELLRTRQWVDLRQLRQRNPDDEAVALKLEDLAKGIRDELRGYERSRQQSAQSVEVWRPSKPTDAELQPTASPVESSDTAMVGLKAEVGNTEAQVIRRGESNIVVDALSYDLETPEKPPDSAPQPSENPSGSLDIAALLFSAEGGNADAQFSLGQKYEIGEGVARDGHHAAAWYRRAAGVGHANAQYHLGVYCDSGQFVAKNQREAGVLYRKAADQGHADAQYKLGEICDSYHHRNYGIDYDSDARGATAS